MTEEELVRSSREALDAFRKRYSPQEVIQMLIDGGTLNEKGEVLLPEGPTLDPPASSNANGTAPQ